MRKTLLALALIACLLLTFVGCDEDEIESEFKDNPYVNNNTGDGTENSTNDGTGTTGTTDDNLNFVGTDPDDHDFGPLKP